MKNVTISMNEDLAHYARVEAAKAGKSVSRYIADVIETQRRKTEKRGEDRNARLARLEQAFAGPEWDVTTNGRMPTSDERNAR
jgi:hypothetical protein